MLGGMVYVAVYAASLPAGFLVYSYLAYRSVYKGAKPKYPMVPPEGKTDAYFPRTDIPRPVYEDARRYPAFFGRRKKRKLVKAERVEKARRKK
jgi:hypothetical protein